MINKVKISNYRYFESFCMELSEFNIIVGQNNVGKSTILEAIDLALTGFVNGKHIKNELSQYYFNEKVVREYIEKLKKGETPELPKIEIEIFFDNDNPELRGSNNSDRKDCSGILFTIKFNELYAEEYSLIANKELTSLPIEYYDIYWISFAGSVVSLRSIYSKSSMIDTSRTRYRNGSDVYISRIVRQKLEDIEKISISQAHRAMRDSFMRAEQIRNINDRIQNESELVEEKFNVSVELSTKNAWETTLIACLDQIPLCFAGKGQ